MQSGDTYCSRAQAMLKTKYMPSTARLCPGLQNMTGVGIESPIELVGGSSGGCCSPLGGGGGLGIRRKPACVNINDGFTRTEA